MKEEWVYDCGCCWSVDNGELCSEHRMPLKSYVEDLKAENTKLRKVIQDTLWMARRYANHRKTYAPSMYNDAVRQLLAMGIEVRGDPAENGQIWAADGDTGLPKEAQEK